MSKGRERDEEMVVCKHFRLVKKLGTGAFGEIYLAEHKNNPHEQYAAKLEETKTSSPQLFYEAKMYKYLHSFGSVAGIPRVIAAATEGHYNVMLMDLLGTSLEDLFVQHNKRLSLRTVLQVASQMLERLETVHEKNILHRDVKPDNFLMGAGHQAHIVYLIDFGLSKKYVQDGKAVAAGKHIPYREGKELTGTARYASINTHMGYEQSRRDDLESLGYVLLYLLRGILPWQNMKAKDTKTKYKMIMEKKMATPVEILCKGFPSQFVNYFLHVKGLKFEERPDYKYLHGLFQAARREHNVDLNNIFDWTQPSSREAHSRLNSETAPQKSDLLFSQPNSLVRIPAPIPHEKASEIRTQHQHTINYSREKSREMGSRSRQEDSGREESKPVFRPMPQGAVPNPRPMLAQKANGTVFSSVGLESLNTKVVGPKISIIKK